MPLLRDQLVLATLQCLMEPEQGRGPEDDRRPWDPAWAKQKRPEAKQQPVERGETGRAPPRPIEHQELLLHQEALGDNGPRAARPQKSSDCPQEVSEEYQDVLHDGAG